MSINKKSIIDLPEKNKESIRLFLQFSKKPFFVIAGDGSSVWQNEASTQLSAYDYMGRSYTLDGICKVIIAAVSGVKNREVQLEVKTGMVYYLLNCVQPELDDIYVTCTDITEWKSAEAYMLKRMSRVETAIRAVGDGIWERDLVNKTAYYSSQYKSMLGYTEAEYDASGLTWADIIHPDDLKSLTVISDYERGIITHHDVEYRVRCKSGDYIWVLDRGMISEWTADGRPSKIIGTHININRQKELELVQQTTAERLHYLVAHLNDGILIQDEYGKTIIANKILYKMFGLPVPETDSNESKEDWLQVIHAMCQDPAIAAGQTRAILHNRTEVINVMLTLKDERVLERSYIPLMVNGVYKGNLWKFSDITGLFTLSRQLLEQKTFYEDILNQIPAVVAVFNAKQEYLFANPLAISDPDLRQWIIGKNDEQYQQYINKPLPFADQRRRIFDEVVASGTQREWEEMVEDSSGNITYWLRHLYPVYDELGNLKIMISYGMDITSRKKTEELVSISEKKFRDVFNFSQAIICTHDLDGKIISVNPAVCNLLGYTEEELIGTYLFDLLPEKGKDMFEENYLEAIRHEDKVKGIFCILTKNGDPVYLLYQNYKMVEPGVEPYVIGFSQDITDRRNAEEALKKSEEKYRGIIENMNIGLLEIDHKDEILYANQSYCRISGFDITELIGRNAKDVFVPQYYQLLHDAHTHAEEVIPEAREIAVRNKKGESKWWLLTVAPFLDNRNSNPPGAIAICMDITPQKAMEIQLREAKAHAEHSAHTKEMFLANMSHEIRTPMNAILNMGKQLEKTIMDVTQQSYLEAINHSASHLLVIINDILDFSKIEAGKLVLQHIAFDLEETMRQAVDVMRIKAEEKNIWLTIKMNAACKQIVIGDPFRLNQVVLNILSNAIKFTNDGGVTVNVFAHDVNEDVLQVSIRVTDTGIGMSEDFLRNLFNEYTQEDEGIAHKYGGTGLGMGISKQLMAMMGGGIDVKSKKDVGTEVLLTMQLPKGNTEDLLHEAEKIVVDGSMLRNKKILLVDDNKMNRLVAMTILKPYGSFITEAENGEDAVAKVVTNAQRAFDIILMDVRMPEMDGISATRLIRSQGFDAVPIIALTASAVKGEREKCLDAGMNDFLSKPFDEESLLQILAKWLQATGEAVTATAAADSSNKETVHMEEKLYDLTALEAMGRNNPDFMKQVLSIFIEEATESMDGIKEAYAQADMERIRQLAHKMKPSVANMGINNIVADLKQVENYPAYNTDELKGVIEKIAHTITKVINALNVYLETL
ncbi:MAG: PAS domain S-box protein [Filimonas sp.]|nr:PAS domain S-box protein [Filimonas sp.]